MENCQLNGSLWSQWRIRCTPRRVMCKLYAYDFFNILRNRCRHLKFYRSDLHKVKNVFTSFYNFNKVFILTIICYHCQMVVWNFAVWNYYTRMRALFIHCRREFIKSSQFWISYWTPNSLSLSTLRTDDAVLARKSFGSTLFRYFIRKIAAFPHDRKLMGWTYYRFAANVW